MREGARDHQHGHFWLQGRVGGLEQAPSHSRAKFDGAARQTKVCHGDTEPRATSDRVRTPCPPKPGHVNSGHSQNSRGFPK